VITPGADAEPSGHERPPVTPPGDITEGLEQAKSGERDMERNAALSPSEFRPAVPEPVKSRLLQLMGKPAMTPEEIKHDEYLAKRRDQWRRRKERKEQEALEHDRD
jgi:hypothetical protein